MKQPATCEHINPQALISICSFEGTEIPNAFAQTEDAGTIRRTTSDFTPIPSPDSNCVERFRF